LWPSACGKKKEYAEIYHRELYPKVEKIVEKYIEGVPIIKEFEAEYSTFHKIAFAAMVWFLFSVYGQRSAAASPGRMRLQASFPAVNERLLFQRVGAFSI
jgi:hypothetical protein